MKKNNGQADGRTLSRPITFNRPAYDEAETNGGYEKRVK